MKLSKVSLENLRVAEFVEVDDRGGYCLVSVSRFGCVSYLFQRSGDLVRFRSVAAAIRWIDGLAVVNGRNGVPVRVLTNVSDSVCA